ncbi:MAG: NAD(+)/NADH kinase [Chloroflexi bacterium]|nr:NAD(+)/NADH kinase [Chloroflexota bacterium]
MRFAARIITPTDAPAAGIATAATNAYDRKTNTTIIKIMSKPLNKIGIAYNSQIAESKPLSGRISNFLESTGAEIMVCCPIQEKTLRKCIAEKVLGALIVIGGDGTMLRASHICAATGIPIVGINLGMFGFLMELQPDDWDEFLPRLLTGDYRVEMRMLMQAEHIRKDVVLNSSLVVNEVVVCRGQHVRPVRLEAEVDGSHMASYVADGLIASTPTGSTAYALAAGGAILPPELRNIIIVPVAPHLSPDQSIILSEGAVVSIRVNTTHQAVFSVDGHLPVLMEDGDCVQVKSSDLNARYIRFRGPGYFYRTLNRYLEQNPSLPNSQRD